MDAFSLYLLVNLVSRLTTSSDVLWLISVHTKGSHLHKEASC